VEAEEGWSVGKAAGGETGEEVGDAGGVGGKEGVAEKFELAEVAVGHAGRRDFNGEEYLVPSTWYLVGG